MIRIDLNAPTIQLLWPVLRANAHPFASSTLLLTIAHVATAMMPQADPNALVNAEALASLVILTLAWVLAQTSLAFAVFPTLLTGGVLSGYAALRRAELPRLATYAGYQSILSLIILLVAIPLIWAALLGGLIDLDQMRSWAGPSVWVFVNILVVLALGLVLPDIVMTGRLSIPLALGWLRRNSVGLMQGIVVGAGPCWLLSQVLIDRTGDGPWMPSGMADVLPFLMALVPVGGAVVLSLLGTVLAMITLAKVYRLVLPPEALLETGRVAEVFD